MEEAGCPQIGQLESDRGCIGLGAINLWEFSAGLDGCIEFFSAVHLLASPHLPLRSACVRMPAAAQQRVRSQTPAAPLVATAT
ncbi:MAG: hypothetical protein ACR2PZ_08970, partial [Pseudomonadales bacterium]